MARERARRAHSNVEHAHFFGSHARASSGLFHEVVFTICIDWPARARFVRAVIHIFHSSVHGDVECCNLLEKCKFFCMKPVVKVLLLRQYGRIKRFYL